MNIKRTETINDVLIRSGIVKPLFRQRIDGILKLGRQLGRLGCTDSGVLLKKKKNQHQHLKKKCSSNKKQRLRQTWLNILMFVSRVERVVVRVNVRSKRMAASNEKHRKEPEIDASKLNLV